ncbi:MAG: spheroidene monooxygenase [Pseudomonadota bacterium]
MAQTVTLTLFHFPTLRSRLWAFAQMGMAKSAFDVIDGVEFHKLMGTGAGAGFSTRPNFSVYAWLAVWRDVDAARDAMENAPIIQNYKSRTDETMTLYLNPIRTRGEWSSMTPFTVGDTVQSGETVVALTRATLRASKAPAFWSRVPAISDAVEADSHQGFMLGMGEVPYLHQVTFSVWTDEAAMRSFSLNSPTHGEAVKAAYTDGWFKEYLFARFNLVDIEGDWSRFDPSLFVPQQTAMMAAE